MLSLRENTASSNSWGLARYPKVLFTNIGDPIPGSFTLAPLLQTTGFCCFPFTFSFITVMFNVSALKSRDLKQFVLCPAY